jgi:peroxiredoxin
MDAPHLRKILLVLAFAAAAALMIIAGSRVGHELAHRREQADIARRMSGSETGESSKLRAGDPFPGVDLIAEADSLGVAAHVDSRAMVAGGEALVFFLSSNCTPCTDAVKRWSESAAEVPRGVLLFGVIDDTPEARRAYVEENNVAFPVLSDSANIFDRDFEMGVYPTVVAVDANGTMVFVRHGIDEGFTPSVAVELLRAGINIGH